MEFTKGKWRLSNGKKNKSIKVSGDEWSSFCKIYFLNSGDKIDETKANALLISKAPEMLEMLQKVVDEYYSDEIEADRTFINKIKQLIKEATEI